MSIKVICTVTPKGSDKPQVKELFFKNRKDLIRNLAGPSINGQTIYNLTKDGRDEVEFPDGNQRVITMEEIVDMKVERKDVPAVMYLRNVVKEFLTDYKPDEHKADCPCKLCIAQNALRATAPYEGVHP